MALAGSARIAHGSDQLQLHLAPGAGSVLGNLRLKPDLEEALLVRRDDLLLALVARPNLCERDLDAVGAAPHVDQVVPDAVVFGSGRDATIL